jgi:hypothetical protein
MHSELSGPNYTDFHYVKQNRRKAKCGVKRRESHAHELQQTFIIWRGKQENRPPLWSSDQSSWLQIQRSRVRFPALSDFPRSGGSGTGSTQPREDNGGAT